MESAQAAAGLCCYGGLRQLRKASSKKLQADASMRDSSSRVLMCGPNRRCAASRSNCEDTGWPSPDYHLTPEVHAGQHAVIAYQPRVLRRASSAVEVIAALSPPP